MEGIGEKCTYFEQTYLIGFKNPSSEWKFPLIKTVICCTRCRRLQLLFEANAMIDDGNSSWIQEVLQNYVLPSVQAVIGLTVFIVLRCVLFVKKIFEMHILTTFCWVNRSAAINQICAILQTEMSWCILKAKSSEISILCDGKLNSNYMLYEKKFRLIQIEEEEILCSRLSIA